MTQTLEQQLDALIAEHGLTSVGLTRIRMDDGTYFWSVHASGGGIAGSNCGVCEGSAQAELAAARGRTALAKAKAGESDRG